MPINVLAPATTVEATNEKVIEMIALS